MTFRTALFTACTAAALSVGAAQAATVYNFDGATPDLGPFELTCSTNAGACTVSHDPGYGYGVSTENDTWGHRVDSQDGTREFLTVTFETAMRVLGLTLGAFNLAEEAQNDDYGIRINGGSWILMGQTQLTNYDLGEVTSLTIGAWGSDANDEFTLQSMTIAAVPLPATGLLMLAALGGLAAVRRRKV